MIQVYYGKVSGPGTKRFIPDSRFVQWLEDVLSLPSVMNRTVEVRLRVLSDTMRKVQPKVAKAAAGYWVVRFG